ncbi:hypothetical protein NY08_213 [Rhodococcus sp. B7740]|nr:hypothetical protein NY08_213 [Rhodococcus sp. B7740]
MELVAKERADHSELSLRHCGHVLLPRVVGVRRCRIPDSNGL